MSYLQESRVHHIYRLSASFYTTTKYDETRECI